MTFSASSPSAHLAEWARAPESFTGAIFQRYRDSGIQVFHHAFGSGGPTAYESAINYFGAVNALIAGTDQYMMRIDSAADFARVKTSGKIGILPGLQNAQHLRRPADVPFFFGLGERVAQLTYNSRNLIGNGSTERRDEGISDFGAAVIDQMNKTGMAIDVSHCGDRTTLDAFELSKMPVLITHSNCRALVPGHPRCKTDDAIRAVGKSGSVMGITGVRNFVKTPSPRRSSDVINHFDHVRTLIGPEHLGVGSDVDLDGYDDLPPEALKQLRAGYKDTYSFRDKIDIEGLDHPKRMFDLTEGLIRRKYSDAEIRGVLGGNSSASRADLGRHEVRPGDPRAYAGPGASCDTGRQRPPAACLLLNHRASASAMSSCSFTAGPLWKERAPVVIDRRGAPGASSAFLMSI